MTTVKLVVIGAAGVGKTSLRGQYISGRFSTGYRATIGADFISKVLPHPTKAGDTVTLQIWDTAGQERFSSLSSAFFRGADAALLRFDVNVPETLEALTKWWDEFRAHAPVSDEDIGDYCCVVVGNKVDIAQSQAGRSPVLYSDAQLFLNQLVPPQAYSHTTPPSDIVIATEEEEEVTEEENVEDDPLAASQATARPISPTHPLDPASPNRSPLLRPRTNSITIISHPPSPSSHRISRRPHSPLSHHRPSSPYSHSTSHSFRQSPLTSPLAQQRRFSKTKSRSRSSDPTSSLHKAYSIGTINTTASGLSIYHTPSSSLFDQFESARTSPEPWDGSSSSHSHSHISSSYPPNGGGPMSSSSLESLSPPFSASSTGNESAATLTPSAYARESEHDEDSANNDHQRYLRRSSSPRRSHSGRRTVASSAASFFSAISTSNFSSAITTPDPAHLHPADSQTTKTTPTSSAPPPHPDTGPKLFYASAKTGEGVRDVFEYIAKRVVGRWELEERMEAGRLEMRDDEYGAGSSGFSNGWGRAHGYDPRKNGNEGRNRDRKRGGGGPTLIRLQNGHGHGSRSAGADNTDANASSFRLGWAGSGSGGGCC